MRMIIAVGVGSCVGGILRYLLSLLIQNRSLSTFPFGTLTVNIIGCFLIGVAFGFSERDLISMEWKLFFITGLLGGFTTFSSFSIETITLLRTGHSWLALSYIGLSIIIGLIATFTGISVIKLF